MFLGATVSQRQRDTLMWTSPVHLHLNSITCFLELKMTFFQTEVYFSMDNFYERFLQVLTYNYHLLKWINLIPNTWSFHPPFFFRVFPRLKYVHIFCKSPILELLAWKMTLFLGRQHSLTSPPGPVMSKPPVPLYMSAPPHGGACAGKADFPSPTHFLSLFTKCLGMRMSCLWFLWLIQGWFPPGRGCWSTEWPLSS